MIAMALVALGSVAAAAQPAANKPASTAAQPAVNKPAPGVPLAKARPSPAQQQANRNLATPTANNAQRAANGQPATTADRKPAAKPTAARTPQSIECSKQADAQNLHGKAREVFRSKCKRAAKA
jgi:hypothetical protein